MKKKNMVRKLKLKPWVRVTLLGLIFILFFAGVYTIYLGFHLKKQNSVQESLYDYNVFENLNYKVYLYKNNSIDAEYLEQGETYINNLVKSIGVDYTFQYSASKIIPLKISNSINAEIFGEYQISSADEKDQVWNKKYVLKEKTTQDVSKNQGTLITEHFDIDFNKFNNEVLEFRKEIGLPITAYLKVDILFEIEGEVEDKFNKEKTITLTIPLNKEAFKIEENYEKTSKEHILSKETYVGKIDNKNLICGIIVIINALFLFFVFFKEIFDIQSKTPYLIKVTKLLKTYGDIIVEVDEVVDYTNYTNIAVKNFNELVDLEEELRIPIIFHEEKINEIGIFSIVYGDICYYYEINNEEK